MKRLSSIILSSLFCVIAMAQQVSPTDYGTEKNMPVFYEQLKAELSFPWSWQRKHSSMSFKKWKEEARRQVEATMQLAPPAPDYMEGTNTSTPAYTVIATEQRDGYKAQKIRFNINKWENVLAYLLIPDKKAAAAPALLLLHDHGAHFAIGKEKMVRPFDVDSTITADARHWAEICYDGKFVGDELAKAGYVVLSIDALLWGDRSCKEDRSDVAGALATKERKQQTYNTQQALASNMLQMGTSWGAWITWDDIRAAHFLSRLPMVDKDRVGCLGFSMGAYRSWMLAALSDDIKVSASVCWMNDTEHLMSLANNQNKGGSAYAMLIPGIRNLMDYPHVASLACPKPALFYNGTRDKLFPLEGVENAYHQMHEVWQAQKADDRLVTKIWPEKHFLNRQMQDSIVTFFNKYLQRQEEPDATTGASPVLSQNIRGHAAPPLDSLTCDSGVVSPVDSLVCDSDVIECKGDTVISRILQVEIPENIIKVKAFDPQTKLTKDTQPLLQAAIDKMAEKGGGKVLVTKGVYYICGPLNMKSNVELHLDNGALLKFSGNPRHYLPVVPTRRERIDFMGRSAMIYADSVENIAITGEGAIDGRAGREMASWSCDSMEYEDLGRLRKMFVDSIPVEQRVFADSAKLRPCMVEFANSKRILIDGITIKDSPFWCIHPLRCSDVTVRNVKIDSFLLDNYGCVPDASTNVLIERCEFVIKRQ